MTHAGRFVTVVWLLVVLIFTSSYTASLASTLSAQQPFPTIGGFEFLLKSSVPIGYQGGSFILNCLSMLGIQEGRLKALDTEQQYVDALRLGPNAGGVGAIVDEQPYVQSFLNTECEFTTVGDQIAFFGGFGFRGSWRVVALVDLILAELKPKFWSLIEGGRSGIITSILKACKKFQSNEQEVCRSLTKALTLEVASPSCVAPRLLFLESYGRSNGSKEWKPVFGGKMSVLGCAILQLIFSYPEECNQQFWLSLAGMEPVDIVATIKDPGGCRVVESFLCLSAPLKQKYRFIARLKGHFAELASRVHSSYTLEKCFSVGKVNIKESIASELAAIQTDLAKSKHGPNLIQKFDLAGYSKMPDQWRTRMVAKEGTMKAFADVFDINKNSTHSLQKDRRKAVKLESNIELKKRGKKKKKKKTAKSGLP